MIAKSLFLSAALAAAVGFCATPAWPAAPPAKPAAKPVPAVASLVEPEAVQALQRMSAYLGTLTAFEIRGDTTSDVVMDDGEIIQFGDQTTYQVRRPNGFVIARVSDHRARSLYYDGKRLTLYAPTLGFYASVEAPGTIRETLQAASDRYGLEVPLADLFKWSEPGGGRADKLTSASVIGAARVDGVDCDLYAFREGQIDWQIWIARGDEPTPRKVVIIDRSDEARPRFTALLRWNVKPSFSNATFAFDPPKDAKSIKLTTAAN